MKTGTRILLWLAGFVVALVVLTLLGTMFAVQRSQAALERYRAELIERGEPLDIAEIAPPKAPVENNGGPELIAAARDLENAVKATKAKLISVGQKEDNGEAEVMHRLPTALQSSASLPWEQAEAMVVPLQPSLDAIRKAAREPVLAIDLDYGKGVAMSLNQLTSLLRATQYLSVDALLRLHRGDTAGAVEDIEAELNLLRITGAHPVLLSQLIHCSLLSLAEVSTWEALQADSVTAEDLVRLQRAWEAAPLPAFTATLRMERAQAGPMFAAASQSMRALTGSASWTGGSSGMVTTPTLSEMSASLGFATWSFIFRHADERQFLENYQSLLDDTEEGKPQDWGRTFATADHIESSLKTAGMGRLFSKMLIPALRTSVERFATTEALRTMTITAIALRRYQLDHAGALPETLEALVPEYLAAVPRDPLDGGTLHYARKENGFLLYSVGLDGVNGGGDASQPPDRKQKSILDREDIVWPRAASSSPTP